LLNPHTQGVDGVEILAQAYRQPAPPAVVVVGERAAEDQPAEVALAVDVLLKPFGADDLRLAAEAALRERQATLLPIERAWGIGWPRGEPSIARLYEQIVQFLMVKLRADRVSLMLWSDGSDRVGVAAWAGAPFATPGDTSAPLNDSVSGWVVRHAEPLLIEPDGDLPFDLQGMWRSDIWCAGLCVPLIARGQVLGVLTATRRRGNAPFDRVDLDAMLPVASQVALALDAAQAQHQAQRRAQFFGRLNSLGTALAGTLDATQALRLTVEHLRAALPEACGYLFLREDESPWFDGAVTIGDTDTPLPDPDELRDTPGLAGLVLADGSPRLRRVAETINDLADWERALVGGAGKALLCVALKTERAVYGVVELASRRGTFDDDDLQFVTAAAALAAHTIEKARLHAAVSRSEARYHALFQHAPDAIFVVDPATMVIVGANPAAERMSGYSQAELSMIPPSRLIAPGGAGRAAPAVADMLAGALPEYEGYIRTRSGYSVPVSIDTAEVVLEAKRHLLLITRNIAEQQRQAQRQAQSEKLAGMARLTASIAHEINNPLQALHNTLHLLLNRSFTEEKRERLLSMAQMEVDRLTALVRRMLDLHRPAHEDMRPISVHGVLESALIGAASQLQQHRVLIERDWAEQLPWVLGIGGHLKQVFQDLATNAVEAMPEGGRLMIRTRLEDGVAGAAPRVLVEFADSGPGISDSEAHLIFEPFYSNKRGGSGLGLAISYSIVERHGGTLSVSSSGEGTTFRVALPAASAVRRAG
jgi:two-component system NtrC family sensor kinase